MSWTFHQTLNGHTYIFNMQPKNSINAKTIAQHHYECIKRKKVQAYNPRQNSSFKMQNSSTDKITKSQVFNFLGLGLNR